MEKITLSLELSRHNYLQLHGDVRQRNIICTSKIYNCRYLKDTKNQIFAHACSKYLASSLVFRSYLYQDPHNKYFLHFTARHGLWGSFNGQIADNYSDSGSIGSVIVATPGAIALPK